MVDLIEEHLVERALARNFAKKRNAGECKNRKAGVQAGPRALVQITQRQVASTGPSHEHEAGRTFGEVSKIFPGQRNVGVRCAGVKEKPEICGGISGVFEGLRTIRNVTGVLGPLILPVFETRFSALL